MTGSALLVYLRGRSKTLGATFRAPIDIEWSVVAPPWVFACHDRVCLRVDEELLMADRKYDCACHAR